MLIYIPIPSVSWISNSGKQNALQNAYNLATCIYRKGPQMLTDAISEVEKLNVTQQLIAMVILPSTVNVMSNEGD